MLSDLDWTWSPVKVKRKKKWIIFQQLIIPELSAPSIQWKVSSSQPVKCRSRPCFDPEAPRKFDYCPI